MFKNISRGALVGAASATISINIDDEKIKNTVTEVATWAKMTSQTPEARAVVGALNQVANKTQFRILASQRELLGPYSRDLRLYLAYLNPDPSKCNVDAFVACSLGSNVNNYWDSLTAMCAYNNHCNVKFADLSS
jgi:hypothetical protein